MIRVVCGDKAHKAMMDVQQGRLVIAGVCIRPQAVEEAGAVCIPRRSSGGMATVAN